MWTIRRTQCHEWSTCGIAAYRNFVDPTGEVSPAEAAWLMAGSLLEFLEIGGPDAVREQLEELPRYQREAAVCAVRDSGYPARETLEDFRVLVAEPILGTPSRPRAVRNIPAQRSRRGKRRGR